MKRKKFPKPRNPFVQRIVARKQGPHIKPYKAQRQKDKAALKAQA